MEVETPVEEPGGDLAHFAQGRSAHEREAGRTASPHISAAVIVLHAVERGASSQESGISRAVYAAMCRWTMKCIKVVGIVALVTVVLALAVVVGTVITALSTQWDEFEQRVE